MCVCECKFEETLLTNFSCVKTSLQRKEQKIANPESMLKIIFIDVDGENM